MIPEAGTDERCRMIADSRRDSARKAREVRMRIQREAFAQTVIPLSDTLGSGRLKMLVGLVSAENAAQMKRYEDYINRRLAVLLSPLIPKVLVRALRDYPESVRVSPGFLYQAGEDYGGGHTFWARPRIPYYFEQGTEQQVLEDTCPAYLPRIDKSVALYHENREKKRERELRCASSLVQNGVRTWFDLLKLNPLWYNLLYRETLERDML